MVVDKLSEDLADLGRKIDSGMRKLGTESMHTELSSLQSRMQTGDFWQNPGEASKISQREADLRRRLEAWDNLKRSAEELIQLAKTGDQSLSDEISAQLKSLTSRFEELQQDLKFNGAYDDRDVIMNIYAGAGGTDAQDWAQMLLRMYSRWAETHGFKVELLDSTPGEEAGIKSAVLRISSGDYLFGKLQGEHGVHRLVRKSPFNSAGSRETSFARVDVLPEIDEPGEVELDDKDLKVDVFRAGGHGGQSVNTADSAVRITHIPTGISVSIQNERSQLQNKETALTILRSRLAQLQLEQHAQKVADIKGPTQAAEWGNQIRNYILDDRIVKDLRTGYETHNPQKVLDGDLDPLIEAYLEKP